MRPPAFQYECEFESQALAAALQSRWPDRVDAELREHVSACRICSDVIVVAWALDAARDHQRANLEVPDSARVWWLAQLRARREAAKAAGRPITAAQVIAFACAMVLLGACFDTGYGLLFVAMIALALLVPTALYLAVGRD